MTSVVWGGVTPSAFAREGRVGIFNRLFPSLGFWSRTIEIPRRREERLQPEDKLDSDLRAVYRLVKEDRDDEAKKLLDGNDVEIEVLKGNEEEAERLIEQNGGRVLSRYHYLMDARITPATLMALAESPVILVIKRLTPLIPAGDPAPQVVSEGVKETLANFWHEKGYTGKGIKVAVVDAAFDGYKEAQAGGELPATLVTKTFGWGPFENDITQKQNPHGTRCAEIIHDMAPEATLYLVRTATFLNGMQAIDYLIAEKVDVISASVVEMIGGPHDGSSQLSKKIDEARSKGILWVNAAGNEAQSHWEGKFQDNGKGLHVWKNGDTRLGFYAPSCPSFYLLWDDWGVGQEGFPGGNSAGQDYILRLLKDGKVVKEVSSNNQKNKSISPDLYLGYTVDQFKAGTYEIEVERVGTTGKGDYLELYMETRNEIEYPVPGGSIPLMADAEGALSVGTLYENSSRGPTNGQGGSAPDKTSRIKPDMVAPTEVTTFIGNSKFGGTSASAPHVAGAAALVKEAYPAKTPSDIQAYLEGMAKKISKYPADKNNKVGNGYLFLLDLKIFGEGPMVTEVDSDGLKGLLEENLDVSTNPPLNSEGNPVNELHIHGYNFTKNSQVFFDPPIIKNEKTYFNNPTWLEMANITFNSNMKPGPVDVIVVNKVGTTEKKGVGKGLLKLHLPIVDSVSPPKQVAGWSGWIAIKGKMLGGNDPTIDLGPQITVQTFPTAYEPFNLLADIKIDSKASPGPRDVVITNKKTGQKIVGKGMFEVVKEMKPLLVWVSPEWGVLQGITQEMEVAGHYFTNEATVDMGTGVTVVQVLGKGFDASVTKWSSLKPEILDYIDLLVKVEKEATPGPRSVTLTNKVGSVVLDNAYQVISGAPKINSIEKIKFIDDKDNLEENEIEESKLEIGFKYSSFFLDGTGFIEGAKVTVDPECTVNEKEIFFLSTKKLSFNVLCTTAGKKNITVTNPNGFSNTAAGLLEVVPHLTITGAPIPDLPLKVPAGYTKTVDQNTMVKSVKELASVTLQCAGQATLKGAPAFDPATAKHFYSFHLQIGNVTEAVLCQITAQNIAGQKATASFQVMPDK